MKQIGLGGWDFGEASNLFIDHLLNHGSGIRELVVDHYSSLYCKMRVQERFSHYIKNKEALPFGCLYRSGPDTPILSFIRIQDKLRSLELQQNSFREDRIFA